MECVTGHSRKVPFLVSHCELQKQDPKNSPEGSWEENCGLCTGRPGAWAAGFPCDLGVRQQPLLGH